MSADLLSSIRNGKKLKKATTRPANKPPPGSEFC